MNGVDFYGALSLLNKAEVMQLFLMKQAVLAFWVHEFHTFAEELLFPFLLFF